MQIKNKWSTVLNMELRDPMHRLLKEIADVLGSRRRYPFFSLATLLHGGSLLYSTATASRNALYDHGMLPTRGVDRPVISIGNITAGGTGKTPMTVQLAKLLKSFGLKVLIVSRGYRSLGEKAGAVVSDGKRLLCDVHTAGDEPYLMASLLRQVPVMVGQNRFKTARRGVKLFSPDVILLDDAFQHQAMLRDINLVLMDANLPLGNGHLLPRGPLREPLSGLNRADAIVFTRCGPSQITVHSDLAHLLSTKHVFHCRHITVLRGMVPAGHSLDHMAMAGEKDSLATISQGGPVFAFSGLANNPNFFCSISKMGRDVRGTAGFPDHHYYSSGEIGDLVRRAEQLDSHALITTDKDFVRLPRSISLKLDLFVLGVEIDFREDTERWQGFIRQRLAACDAQISKDSQISTRVD